MLETLRVDAVIREVFDALRTQGMRPILLKGPVIAAWLYEQPGDRLYVDGDVMVAPAQLAESERVLRSLGFTPDHFGLTRDSREWRRGTAQIDLHTSITGIGVEPERAWKLLTADTSSAVVGGTTAVEALAEPARALHLALHVAQHASAVAKPREDLERALAMVPQETWEAAATLAEQLDAQPAFTTGLRRVDGGQAVLDRLRLRPVATPMIVLLEHGAPPGAMGLTQISSARVRDLPAEIARAIVPPAAYMRRVWPGHRPGAAGLAAAHVQRWLRLTLGLPVALSSWRAARRSAAEPHRP
ncbi:MAG: hypothetical protein AVDCRST_MAG85-1258 [uncultured Solirubrobacteraceae bacterium]|uniref:Nucleotidyltransferase family protein n=1 Tax=uncultured Solirubrobacteraceae bacterium TaxID=1162706 RepID=A0A6J4SEN7_9ACTN|nr:MAG: hypothetical protein AVDCRST_MAG85-1258 [uncultured Solirubrobacteraceae bacterium]